MFRGQLIYQLCCHHFSCVPKLVFSLKGKKKNTARLKEFSKKNDLGKKHLPVETSHKYKKGTSFHIKAKAAAEAFFQQRVEREKLWYFEQAEFCACICMSFQKGA